MADPFVGEIRMFGFTFAPINWAFCNGQLMAIAQNDALFALIGTTYGGDGVTTFALPNLQGRIPLHQGTGAGLSTYIQGQISGSETRSLTSQQLPTHSHTVQASGADGSATRPGGAVLARTTDSIYAPSPDGTVLNAGTLSNTGGNGAFSIVQPYVAINFCICLFGIFPARN